jgi:hypothetical protein
LSAFTADIIRILPSTTLPDHIRPLLRSLQHVETKHRKTVQPLLLALTSAIANNFTIIHSSAYDDAEKACDLSKEEKSMIRSSVELRGLSKAVVDGDAVLNARRLTEEFERRE